MPRRKSPTTIIEEIILDGNEDLGGILTKLDQENMPRRTNIQITLKQRDKRNKCEEKREKSGKKMEDVPAKGLDINETEKDNVGNKQQSVVSHESQRLSDKLEVFWCSSCNLEFDTDVEYLRHLHCPSHMNNTKAEEPWLNTSSDPVSPPPATPQQKHQICTGSQWLIPVVAWYCKLCHDCFADIRQAAKHLQCPQHWTKLEVHLVI
ncbi:zinc finger matrin-type protein CG9776-like [Diaphorina citri]|uniref:Zinc finger matrin-type protein CG9776-like n=1 Tax=Diaphorina citri TaxID=121845 RepID=A0A3Q0IIM9_DIACI|nr:zinc finger matrin-type protein CG9776-like [Diaphorina citri]